jgi:hypothetical protein
MLNPGVSSSAARVAANPRINSTSQKKTRLLKKISRFVGSMSIFLSAASAFGGVVIDEIMYHPASDNVLESYVELRNLDNVATNISGWRFTKGVSFTFPTNTLLGPGAYLVVAADGAAFTNKYPGVANFLAGFAGIVGHHLKLEDTAGNTMSELQFADDGDWSTRILTTNGLASYGHYSWEWSAPQDGGGFSLELINPAMSISFAQNWGPSTVLGGTPGGPNSIARTNVAPFVTDVAHSPVIPRPTDVVTVSARITDEHTSGLNVAIFYRNASTATPPAFSNAPMYDDGTHGDGLAGDGIYAAILPAQPAGTIIEFYLQAADLESNVRIYPNVLPPTNSLRTANLLYQVDEGTYAGSQPVYRLIMTEMERAELYAIGGPNCPDYDSDAQMNATWISSDGVSSGGTTTQLRYNVGVRNRGHGTRHTRPNNYHVNIPSDRSWKGVTGINLNSQYSYSQMLGSAVFRRLEVPMPESRAVQVRVNSTNIMSLSGLPDNNSFGSYAANEQYNNDFIQRAFPLDPNGNSYRGIRQAALCDPLYSTNVADFVWHGPNYAQEIYTNSYFKQNNFISNDWSDLIDLIAVLNSVNGYSPANYANDIQSHLNVEEWMKYMAINTLLDNDETCLANGVGDDYALYHGSNDPRWLALPYDLDTLMGRGLTSVPPMHSIWRMTAIPTMNTFMKRPEFAPIYFKWLKAYCDTLFSAGQMNPLLDQLMNSFVPQATINTMKGFNAAQVSNVLAQIPLGLTVSNALTVQSGFPHTTTPSVTLFGTANAIDTRTVLVNGSTAAWTAWQGRWTNTLSLSPGVNRVFVQALNSNSVEIASTYIDIWYDRGAVTTVGGTIATDTTWTAAGGPYSVTSTLTINPGITLTIQPGTTVYLGSGVNFTVANGGTLLAEGTLAAPIRFTVTPGSGVSWGGMTINGAVGSPETRIAYAFFDGNGTTCIEVGGGTLYLDHTSFGTTTHQYVSLDSSSFLISSCIFPTTTAAFELLHGTGGIKSGGRGIVRDCFFGTTTGSNDIMDFTGGNRDLGQPIVQYYNNVFIGATDDQLDLDGTDAWIEGNIFLHSHLGPVHTVAGTSSPISGGSNGSDTSQITMIGNIFYDCDNVAQAKQGNFYTLLNNTIVHQNHLAGNDTDGAVVATADENASEAAGMYLEGNIIYDAEKLVRNHTNSIVTFSNNLMPFAWSGPGGGNSTNDPLLKYIPQVSETAFTNWQQAQVMRDWFSLLPASPARGTGPNGRDMGGVIPIGASISGEPMGTNNQATATLRAGIVRTGSGIPVSGWPNGSGYTHYKWRLDSGAWSAETPTANPINLSGLANGFHRVDVTGKRDSGWYQDAPDFGPDALVTTGRTWIVDSSYVPPSRPTVRLNEILAQNSTTLTNGGTTPDLIELYNYGTSTVDLSGMGLTDNAGLPYKYTFPASTVLGAGQYLVLFADSQTGTGIHLGFSLKASGDNVYLTDKAINGGSLIDSVVFGIQVADYSIGRATDGSWALCKPTFGSGNIVLPLGEQHGLKINEWLADALFLASHDFIELYNPAALPVALGGCYLSDAEGAPSRNQIPALSFIGPVGFVSFTADGDATQGADHVDFKLDPNVGIIILSDAALNPIDIINYGPQQTDVSQGRSPNGSDTFVNFFTPTPGGPNQAPNGGTTSVTNITAVSVSLLTITNSWKWDNSGGTNLGTSWLQTGFNDSTWSSGLPLFGFETTPAEYPYPFLTTIPAPDQAGGHITTYYRTHFQWNGSLTNVNLMSTNYIDDGVVYYLNGARAGSLRMPLTVTYSTLATQQLSEGVSEILTLAATNLVVGDNVMAVELHQNSTGSSDDVFGMLLSAVQFTTNIITMTTVGVPVALNEILASNHSFTNASGATPDWIELYNTSTNSVNLAGLSLSDDPNAPRKFVFAPGTTIPASGFLVMYCDNNSPSSSNNTGFNLSASGATIFLFNSVTNGGGLIDSVSFGLQAADFSIGRSPNGSGTWGLNTPTPGAPNSTAALGSVASLSVNEWMADPASGSDWFELYNSDTQPVSLGGLFFTDDLTKPTLSPMRPLSFIGTGAGAFIQFHADSNPNAGADHVNFKLSKSGDNVALYSSAGILITAVSFGAQATGVSQGRFPNGSSNIISFTTTPSPGESNFLPLTNAVVNEILTHTDPPLEDAVEIYNPGSLSANIGGWFLSNSQEDFKKYRVPDGTTVPAHGFKVFYEYQFNPSNGSSVPFTFNSAHGDNTYLSEADSGGSLTGYRATASFGAAAHGVSFGRYINSIGTVNYVAMSGISFGVDNPTTVDQFRLGTGEPNPYPLVGPVVINEIMFNPPSLDGTEDNVQDEYLELLNLTPYPVPFYDPAAPTNTWQIKGGVDYTFPQNVTLDAAGFLLLVNFDPASDLGTLAEFRSRYHLSNSVPLFGPYGGHLANSGENIALYKPDPPQLPPHPDAGFVPYVLVEEINYASAFPWPTGAAGTGSSLQRQTASNYGDDPANWFVAGPTAGTLNTTNAFDADGDGLPDAWEIQYFGSISDPRATPNADPDGDGFTNLQEYYAGTDPLDPNSLLKINSVNVASGTATIHFNAIAGRTYSILYRADLRNSSWNKLVDVPAQGSTGIVTVNDPTIGNGPRFYRLVTPKLP